MEKVHQEPAVFVREYILNANNAQAQQFAVHAIQTAII